MASELVGAATSEKLKEMDWSKNIEICELVATNHGLAKDVIKSIKKRLGSKNPNTQLYAVLLLEMLMNNCGEHIHKQVIDNGLLPVLVKIVKKKNDLPVRERIFLLLDATQTSLGGTSGRFPQYYAAYYDLVSAKVQFPQRPQAPPRNMPTPNASANGVPLGKAISTKEDDAVQQQTTQVIPDSSIIEKATSVMEVLHEVLDAIDSRHPESASDEFTLDLVEQCSFQKQRLMHLIMTSRDEKVVSQAIELNEKLHNILVKHDNLLSVHPTPTVASVSYEEEEEEDTDRLLRRLRKGKACAEDQSGVSQTPYRSHHGENTRPLSRPLCIEPSNHINSNLAQQKHAPLAPPQPASNGTVPTSTFVIPPPPAKHTEREKFFKEKQVDGLPGHMRGLSLHSQTGSSSRSSSSTDFPDREHFNLRD